MEIGEFPHIFSFVDKEKCEKLPLSGLNLRKKKKKLFPDHQCDVKSKFDLVQMKIMVYLCFHRKDTITKFSFDAFFFLVFSRTRIIAHDYPI